MVKVNVVTGIIATVSVLLLQSCATSEELFSRYDNAFCLAHDEPVKAPFSYVPAEVQAKAPVPKINKQSQVSVPKIKEPVPEIKEPVQVSVPKTKEPENDLNTDWAPAVYFEYNSTELTSIARQNLETNVRILKQFKDHQISLKGFTDKLGSDEYNLTLSGRRVAAVKSFLTNTMKLETNIVTGIAYGEDKIEDSGDRPTDDSLRRVELLLLDSQQVPVKPAIAPGSNEK